MLKQLLIALCCTSLSITAVSQSIPVDESSTAHLITPIGSVFNRIFNPRDLDSFYLKLSQVKKNKKAVVRIVHIGDSHIQGGHLSSFVRNKLQDFFGNAGRGLVFPYDIVQTNSPPDIRSYSNVSWKTHKVVISGSTTGAGISGYGIQTNTTGATINLSLVGDGQDSVAAVFNKIKLFTGKSNTAWLLKASANATSYIVKADVNEHSPFIAIQLENPSSDFSLSSLPSPQPSAFYGVSLENDQPGVIYHSIGVNGARYDQYNMSPFFWQQLPGLQADLYIISLGTNEAQRASFDGVAFRKHISSFLQKIKTASPRAAVIITTAPDSYRQGRPNAVLRSLNNFLFEYCTQHSIPVWDLYRVTNGYGAAFNWLGRGYMNADLIHFTPAGYRLQGQLLFNAIAKGYNEFIGY